MKIETREAITQLFPRNILATLTLEVAGRTATVEAVNASNEIRYWVTPENRAYTREELEQHPGAIQAALHVLDEALAYASKN